MGHDPRIEFAEELSDFLNDWGFTQSGIERALDGKSIEINGLKWNFQKTIWQRAFQGRELPTPDQFDALIAALRISGSERLRRLLERNRAISGPGAVDWHVALRLAVGKESIADIVGHEKDKSRGKNKSHRDFRWSTQPDFVIEEELACIREANDLGFLEEALRSSEQLWFHLRKTKKVELALRAGLELGSHTRADRKVERSADVLANVEELASGFSDAYQRDALHSAMLTREMLYPEDITHAWEYVEILSNKVNEVYPAGDPEKRKDRSRALNELLRDQVRLAFIHIEQLQDDGWVRCREALDLHQAVAADVQEPPLRSMNAEIASRACIYLGDIDHAEVLLREAQLLRPVWSPLAEAKLLRTDGLLDARRGDLDGGLDKIRRGIDICRTHGYENNSEKLARAAQLARRFAAHARVCNVKFSATPAVKIRNYLSG